MKENIQTMVWLKRFLQLVLTGSLVILLTLTAVLQVTSSGIALNKIVKDTGYYEIAAKEVGANLKSSSRIPVEYQMLFNRAVDKALTGAEVEAIIQPALVDVAEWLQQDTNAEVPDIVLIIKPAKTKLITEMQNGGLPPAEVEQIQANLTNQIPDQIQLSSLRGLTGSTPEAASPAGGMTAELAPSSQDAAPDPLVESLVQIKKYNSLAGTARLVVLGIVILSLVSLLWFGRRDGRAWLRRPGWAAIASGGLFIVCTLVVPYVLPAQSPATSAQNFGLGVVPLIASQFFAAAIIPAVLVTIIGLTLVFGAFLIRPKTSSMQPISQLPYRKV